MTRNSRLVYEAERISGAANMLLLRGSLLLGHLLCGLSF